MGTLFTTLEFTIEGGVARIWLNRPELRNAFDDIVIAELTQADGPVERQEGAADWKPAAIGTEYVIGDAARTAEGSAQLRFESPGLAVSLQVHQR